MILLASKNSNTLIGHVSEIHKSGPRSKAANYRPISLTSVPGKIMERHKGPISRTYDKK